VPAVCDEMTSIDFAKQQPKSIELNRSSDSINGHPSFLDSRKADLPQE
jgi:hypothetical protein